MPKCLLGLRTLLQAGRSLLLIPTHLYPHSWKSFSLLFTFQIVFPVFLLPHSSTYVYIEALSKYNIYHRT